MSDEPSGVPIAYNMQSVIRAVRDLRELVLRLYHGDRNSGQRRAVRVDDLVKLGLITEEQAASLSET